MLLDNQLVNKLFWENMKEQYYINNSQPLDSISSHIKSNTHPHILFALGTILTSTSNHGQLKTSLTDGSKTSKKFHPLTPTFKETGYLIFLMLMFCVT